MYTVAPGRSFTDATILVDAGFDGTLVHDGWIVYDQSSRPPIRRVWPISCVELMS